MSDLSIQSLKKSFGRMPVIENLTLSCGAGESLLLLGSNGAGKSTLLRICAGLSRPDSGAIALGGRSPGKSLARIGYVSHQSMAYSEFTVIEQLRFMSHLRKQNFSSEQLEEWQLTTLADRPIKQLSAGQRARVSLAQAFSHKPDLLLLDEPSSALDDSTCELLIKKVQLATQRGALSIIATHDLQRLRGLASRVLVLSAGQLRHDSCESGNTEESIRFYRELNR